MKQYLFYSLLLLIMLLSYSSVAEAQISEGGTPSSFLYHKSSKATFQPHQVAVDLDIEALLKEDEEREADGMPLRCGKIIPVSLSMERDARPVELPDGQTVWQLEIEAEGAIALLLYYDRFIIPEGGKLFIYDPERRKVLGAYTSKTNPKRSTFATEFIPGDCVILEYEPSGDGSDMISLPEIELSGIGYGYTNLRIQNINDVVGVRGKAGACNVNINCSEGADWQVQKKGVARMATPTATDVSLCTGTLINNTNYDFTPLFLTAFHCYQNRTEEQINQTVFYFNYEDSDCEVLTVEPECPTLVGAEYLAKSSLYGESDGALMRLNSEVPEEYDVYFNGWDRRNIPATSGVGIHHPAGDAKKISTFSTPAISNTWVGAGAVGATDAHWHVDFVATEHGHGITEGGSSGSPLFNQDKLVIGTLSGGSSSCYKLDGLNLYGKLWYHWDQAKEKMAPFLDSANTGEETLQGIHRSERVSVARFAFPNEIIQNHSIPFTNTSRGDETHYWSFENATPMTSTETNPVVVFNTPGEQKVSLCINKGTEYENTKSMTIFVEEELAPAADFLMNDSSEDILQIYQGETVSFGNISEGTHRAYSWSFQEGEPNVSSEAHPTVTFLKKGTFSVSLTVSSYLGTDTKEKSIKVIGRAPVAEFLSSSEYFTKYPDHGQFLPATGGSVSFADYSDHFAEAWEWSFPGATTNNSSQKEVEVLYPKGEANYSVRLDISNADGVSEIEKPEYIQVGGVAPVWNIPFGYKGDSYFEVSQGNYLTGTNTFYTALAERFDSRHKGSVRKVDILIKVMNGNPANKAYPISLYSDKDGLPDASLASKTLYGSNINSDGYTTVDFGQQVKLDGPFFIVIGGLGMHIDNIAIAASHNEEGTVFVRDGNLWREMQNYYDGDWNVSMNIKPYFKYEDVVALDAVENSSWSVYPNPVNEILTIKKESLIESLRLTDISGRLMLNINDIDALEYHLDISAFAKGIYLLNVDGKEMKIVKN